MVSGQIHPCEIAVAGQPVWVEVGDAVVFQHQVEEWSMMENIRWQLSKFIVCAQFGWEELENNLWPAASFQLF